MKLKKYILVFPIAIIGLIFHFQSSKSGFEFNKTSALKDIRKGLVKLPYNGMGGVRPEVNHLSSKYGFVEYNLGCEVNYNPGVEEYRKLVTDYLVRSNGPNWQSTYQRERELLELKLDSIYLG